VKTWNAGEPGCPATIDATLRQIEAAAGDYAASDANPCGLAAYYDEGESCPWRIGDDQASETYATADEAEAGAEAWAAAMADE